MTSLLGKPAVLLTLKLIEPWQTQLRDLLQQSGFSLLEPDTHTTAESLIASAEIALLHTDPFPACVSAPGLRWIHGGHAGLDAYLPAALFKPGCTVTSASGRSAPALAENALFMLMQLAYSNNELAWLRRWRQWQAPPVERRRALHGRTLGIIGMGYTGSALAAYAAALGMKVLGWRRRAEAFPPGVEQGFSLAAGDRLTDFLARCEFVVLACTLTQQSRGLLGAAELSAMPRGSFLVNIARAALVDEKALLAALASGHLAGAGLDVHFQEPLPVRSVWWSHPKVVMSPHNTPRADSRDERHFNLIVDNLQRYLASMPLRNALSVEDVCESTPRAPDRWRERFSRRLWNLGYRCERKWRGV